MWLALASGTLASMMKQRLDKHLNTEACPLGSCLPCCREARSRLFDKRARVQKNNKSPRMFLFSSQLNAASWVISATPCRIEKNLSAEPSQPIKLQEINHCSFKQLFVMNVWGDLLHTHEQLEQTNREIPLSLTPGTAMQLPWQPRLVTAAAHVPRSGTGTKAARNSKLKWENWGPQIKTRSQNRNTRGRAIAVMEPQRSSSGRRKAGQATCNAALLWSLLASTSPSGNAGKSSHPGLWC